MAADLALLVKRLDPVGRSILLSLSRAGQEGITTAEMLAMHTVTASDAESAVERVNKFSEAFGYVPLVIESADVRRINSTAPEIVERALDETEQYQ